MVTMRSETLNQRDEIVQVLIAKLVVHRRSPTGATKGEGAD
jgi:acyl dehydratase